MKRSALSMVVAGLSTVALMLIGGCGERPRGAQVTSNSWTGFIDAQLWSDHQAYEFGEPVTVGVTLTNVSKQHMVLQSQAGDVPIIDIEIEAIRNVGEDPIFYRWSEGNPDKTQRTVNLAPGDSYIVTWTLQPPVPAIYTVRGWWANSRGRWKMVLGIEYGARPPNP